MADTLTAGDLALIRDEIGTGEPTDTTLRRSYLELGHWLPVALRVLRRRRADATAGGGVSAVNVPGAVSLTLTKAEIAALDAQISRLQAQWDAVNGITVAGPSLSFGRVVRCDTAR